MFRLLVECGRHAQGHPRFLGSDTVHVYGDGSAVLAEFNADSDIGEGRKRWLGKPGQSTFFCIFGYTCVSRFPLPPCVSMIWLQL